MKKNMFTQKEINEGKSNNLYWQFNDWVKKIRLNSYERNEIEDIIDSLRKLI